ncbi:MAG: saccharopine dehydrogenase NADP-binding domain-containing protein [Gammaproteobacteria bacterium]|nr:saccharopine dehydrogenase NADP-binding domain-containing protein [Gammaproteobacteria bacterium]
MSKRIVVFGSGFVAGPVVEFLSRREENQITVASNILAEANRLATKYPRVSCVEVDVTNESQISELVAEHDIAISLVPYVFHTLIAGVCIKFKKHLVTASYVSKEMRELDQQAREANVLILNEIGLDPGIDHLSAMKVIDDAHAKGAKVKSFASWCGGLPAPECNDNPLGYKFAWAPRGVLMALLNEAQYLKAGDVVTVNSNALMKSAKPVTLSEELDLEGYPNRDSVPYREAYGIPECDNLIRGTLRYKGFSEILDDAHLLGLLKVDSKPDEKITWAEWFEEAEKEVGGISSKSKQALEWLGLIDPNSKLPVVDSMLDAFCTMLQAKLQYENDQFDMIALQHRFEIVHNDKSEYLSSTLVVKGDPKGFSAMSKTVGYPVGIATQMILDGDISDTGVKIPVEQHIYEPILEGLKAENIECIEQPMNALNENFFIG